MPSLCTDSMHGAPNTMLYACKTCNAWTISLKQNVVIQGMHGKITLNMSESTYKYCSLDMGGDRFDYCYDSTSGAVSTQLFPGIPIHRVTLGCGLRASHDDIRTIVEYKLGIASNMQFEKLF